MKSGAYYPITTSKYNYINSPIKGHDEKTNRSLNPDAASGGGGGGGGQLPPHGFAFFFLFLLLVSSVTYGDDDNTLPHCGIIILQ